LPEKLIGCLIFFYDDQENEYRSQLNQTPTGNYGWFYFSTNFNLNFSFMGVLCRYSKQSGRQTENVPQLFTWVSKWNIYHAIKYIII
jgi:hypothetical protein